MNTDEIMTISDAASELNISKKALYKAIKDNRIASTEVLGKTVIRRSDVAEYLPRSYRGRAGRGVGGRPKKGNGL